MTTLKYCPAGSTEIVPIDKYILEDGFSYKEYPDLPEEIWKEVEGSKNSQGRWEVSNKKRAKYTTRKHMSIVYDSFNERGGYPSIQVNGKYKQIHILVFKAFNPDVKVGKNVVRHIDDNPKNFVPENLAIGTRTENGKDAHDNGRYNDTKSARRSVSSYIDGVKERDFKSITDAVKHLKENGYPNADRGGIHKGLNTTSVRYGRTWKS